MIKITVWTDPKGGVQFLRKVEINGKRWHCGLLFEKNTPLGEAVKTFQDFSDKELKKYLEAATR